MTNESGKSILPDAVVGDSETQVVGFAAVEMTACPACERANAPDRAKCLYCAAEMPVRAGGAAVKVSFRPLEGWEKGHNIVLMRAGISDVSETARLLSEFLPLDAEQILEAIEPGSPVPLARVETQAEATALIERGAAHSLELRVVGDEGLRAGDPPRRLRSLGLEDGNLTAISFNTNEAATFDALGIELIVAGVVVSSISDSVETKKIRKAGQIESSDSSADEVVIDIYVKGDRVGFRIPGRGFDFSCLGDEKMLTAGENSRRLIARLATFCTGAVVDQHYNEVRHILDVVWPPEAERGSAGFQRKGIGGVEVTRRVTHDRTMQFTKYSRMLREVL